MGSSRGDQIELQEGLRYLLKPRRIDYSKLGTLRDTISRAAPWTSGVPG